MKKYFLFLPALLFIEFSTAQNAIPNPGFENWNVNPNYDDPVGWGTINGFTYFLGVRTVTKTTDKHSGSFAIKLQSFDVILQGTAPGIAATGNINTAGYIDGGVAYTKRPISMSGWYKYTPSGADTASIEATLSKWNSTAQMREEVGKAVFTQNLTVGSYTQFSVNFTYTSANFPDTLVMILLTSSQGNASPVGSILFVDDLAFELCTGFSASSTVIDATSVSASDGSITVTPAGGTSPYSVAWNSGNGTNLAPGAYCYIVTDANNCIATGCDTVSFPTVIGDLSSETIKLYPNPFGDEVNLQYLVRTQSKVKMELFNVMGQKLQTIMDQSKQPGNYFQTLYTQELNPGVYFVNLSVDQSSVIRKIIKVE